MTDISTAELALVEAIDKRVAYHARFEKTKPAPAVLPPDAQGGIDLAELKRLDDLVCERGAEYDQAWEEAGRPAKHINWRESQPDLQCEQRTSELGEAPSP